MLEIRQLVEAVLPVVKGIPELLDSCRDGIEFLERLRRSVSEILSWVFYAWSLERLDERILRGRDRSRWEVRDS